jgi:hypothetical protein
MSTKLLRSSLLWLALSASLPALPAPASAISFAESPVRLVRDTGLYAATRGARLQPGDLIESGASPIQLEGMGGPTVALGPASRAYLQLTGDTVELTLLSGWLKVQPGAGTSSLSINSGRLRINPESASLIVHTVAGKTALFVESGTPSVAEMQGAKALRSTRLAKEQYAVYFSKEPLKVLPRPKDFASTMPPAFFDPLVPLSFKGAAPAPKLERAAVFATDVAPMLVDDPAVFQVLNRRFNPPPKRSAPIAPLAPSAPGAPDKPAARDTLLY